MEREIENIILFTLAGLAFVFLIFAVSYVEMKTENITFENTTVENTTVENTTVENTTVENTTVITIEEEIIITPVNQTDAVVVKSLFPDIAYFYKDCEVFGEDIISFSHCVNTRVKSKFSYVESFDNPVFGFNEYDNLMEKGGDCYDWALFYEFIFKLTNDVHGAIVEVVIVETSETTAHAYTTVFNDYGYCKLDQENIECIKF